MGTSVIVTLKLGNLSAPQKVAFAMHIQSSMTGNVNFTSPFPSPIASSWVTAAITKQAKHTITGLTTGTNYSFRVALVIKTGQQPFSNAVALLVL